MHKKRRIFSYIRKSYYRKIKALLMIWIKYPYKIGREKKTRSYKLMTFTGKINVSFPRFQWKNQSFNTSKICAQQIANAVNLRRNRFVAWRWKITRWRRNKIKINDNATNQCETKRENVHTPWSNRVYFTFFLLLLLLRGTFTAPMSK